ncbi:MAG: Flp pilus assembly protein CpaB [Elusimicrobia bacterium RIFOXYB12_FULL_50_12]|nr:MAG: Flp pilus assembly protein CpaB [Elusimicrobia bacterium RIFOXYB1_FULL_48_9]OGS16710.1 MAG: Flp pilus assembly protein CpaB [Elusimicrobia bacterium RIFOXYA2_FULL_47_53]OGS26763.1 MAG: Flp pilus assembly protein CpaB [Elusimicrobia bacterium RIFOXYB12_FULL_50_12]OGS31669.1 MAG: Flp pilus assembly protein CpaB [Elusimicrobia bacterium RIFOXYB2_FULL_46_23]
MKKPILLAVLSAGFAALFTMLYLNSLEMTYKKGADKAPVLIAKQYIEQGMMLDETLIEESSAPKNYIQPKALSAIKELTNSEGRKNFMALAPIEKGEQITATKLAVLGLDTGLSAVIPNDKRAVTLVLNNEDVAGIIKPGNRVDIIAVVDYSNKEGKMQEASATILQNILILSVGSNILGTAANTDSNEKQDGLSSISQSRIPVGLSVTQQEAELLVLSSEKGVIKFSLRPIGDDRISQIQPARMQDIFKDISVVTSNRGAEAVLGAKDMQSKQNEALEILKKYKKD